MPLTRLSNKRQEVHPDKKTARETCPTDFRVVHRYPPHILTDIASLKQSLKCQKQSTGLPYKDGTPKRSQYSDLAD